MQHLTLAQRYKIETLLGEGVPVRTIAERIQVHRSTVHREIRLYKTCSGYKAEAASILRKSRYKGAKRKISGTVEARIKRRLIKDQWSPEQIAGHAKRVGQVQVSHETIYQFIHRDAEEGGTLYLHLRHRKKKRQMRSNTYKRRGQIRDRISIEERPLIANEKVEVGHLEGDTMVGKDGSGRILTLVDKKTMFTMAFLLPSGQAKITAEAIIALLKKRKIPWKTLTLDNGKEFADHKQIKEKTGVSIYFCHPYASYERGLNENHNGLLRQYFPKNQSFASLSQRDVEVALAKLNNRPRKSLGYLSPIQELARIKKQERSQKTVAIST
jgi:transposase, IS30 family